MEDVLQPFSAVYGSLPAAPFKTIGESGGVVVRSAVAEDSRWIYAVNGTDVPHEVSLRFSSRGKLRGLGLNPTEASVAPGRPITIKLQPFGLVAWKTAVGVVPALAMVEKTPPETRTASR